MQRHRAGTAVRERCGHSNATRERVLRGQTGAQPRTVCSAHVVTVALTVTANVLECPFHARQHSTHSTHKPMGLPPSQVRTLRLARFSSCARATP